MTNYRDLLLLAACAAFALGEGLGASMPSGAEAWALPMASAALVALLGYGYALRGWHYLSLALLGLSLVWCASLSDERAFRETPWMRGARSRTRESSGAMPLVRRELSRRLALGLDPHSEAVSLNRAILLGERSRICRETKRAFVESGTIHVFAISGMHVMVVVRVLMVFAALLFVPSRFQGLVALPVAWAYVTLIGAPSSAVRAIVMATFYLSAPIFGRRPDGLRAWVLAFFLVHLVHPLQIAEVGSQFSFLVMLALVVVGRELRGMREGWRKTLALSLSAWAVGVPVAARTFGTVTPGGMLANLVMIGAAAHSVVAGVVALLASFVSERVAMHLNNLAALLTEGMSALSWCVSRLPGSHFTVPSWRGYMMIEWYVALILTLCLVSLVRSRRRRV